MDDPALWRWIWLAGSATFLIGELASPGTFFMLPFAIGAAVATVLAFLDVNVAVQWGAFVVVSAAAFGALVPLRRRLDVNEPQDGIGARRLMGQSAVVIRALPAGSHDAGIVRIAGEDWRAVSLDGHGVPEGTAVKVVEVRGTRLVVHPLALPPASTATTTEAATTEAATGEASTPQPDARPKEFDR